MLSRSEGRVAFFNADKGYGFLIPDSGGPDVFVHLYSLPDGIDQLEKGQRVRYSVRESCRKPGQIEAADAADRAVGHGCRTLREAVLAWLALP
jgi:cold shock CspA family protein